ncbi:macro domain-containing protein [Roseimicrobium sp. ORNL1]|uniref:macro domain-containing protein n=1 Tax=Roseimicrobium sp. ORNL1 TaxID=2711231 RepID=UPI0013E0F9B4|nr:macro domain-containing protein [Roseimicrobium sp. ORNL1]QIF03256.1 AraC family transcriptional regulator [Roseimicrobium sp. ORNL1]
MKLHFVDINPVVADALAHAFREHPDVGVSCGDILQIAHHCIVSPANSFGYMDGGIDARYLEFFGPSIQSIVQDTIQRRAEGMLPVGAALAVATRHVRIPYMIVAPTMEVPEEVPASHAGRALRAALRVVDREPALADQVYCPGMATLTGRVPAAEAAASMLSAYEHWLQK